jgi:hypothetical protein
MLPRQLFGIITSFGVVKMRLFGSHIDILAVVCEAARELY